MAWSRSRPDPSEYDEFYAGYVGRVPDGDILDRLASEIDTSMALLRPLGPDRAGHRYAPGKWSIAEMAGHLADAERVFAYRALRFARNDPTPLPGFDQDRYVEHARFDERDLGDVLDEWEALRRANVVLLRSFDDEMALRTGIANGVPCTPRAIAWILAGHELHHRRILEERYL